MFFKDHVLWWKNRMTCEKDPFTLVRCCQDHRFHVNEQEKPWDGFKSSAKFFLTSFFSFFFFFKSFSLRSLMRCFPYSLASVIVACFASSWRICLAYLIMVSLGSFFTVKFRMWAIQMELQSPTTGSYIGCSISYKARVMLFPISPWGITQAKFLSMCVH